MAEEVYTDPGAQAAVLGVGPSPENQQIAANIMTQGLQNVMQAQPPQDPGTGIPTEMPPTGGPPSQDFEALERGATERAEGAAGEVERAEWMDRNENKKVPWDHNVTWGDFLTRVYTDAEKAQEGTGINAVSEFVDSEIERELIEADPNQQQIRAPEIPVLPLPGNNEQQMAAAAENIAAAEAPPPMAPVAPPPMAPAADQQGIMAAANGGIVGYAQGGMNQGAVSEEEFMNVLNAEASQAGIPPEQIAAITEEATKTTGGPMGANDNVMDTGIMQNVEPVGGTDADMTGIGSLTEISKKLVDSGEEGLAHVSPGELIFDPSRLNEPDQRMLMAALETAGIDPTQVTVGNANNIHHEMTGLPAFGFFDWLKRTVRKVGRFIKKGAKKVGGFLKDNAGTILGIAGAMTGNPWLAALGSGIGALIEGKGIKEALIGAGVSYIGTRWVGPWIGKQVTAGLNYISPGLGGVTTGAAIQKALPTGKVGTAIGSKVGEYTAQGVAQKAVLQGAQEAAAAAATKLGTSVGETALAEAAAAAARDSLVQSAMSGAGASSAWGLGAMGLTETAMAGINETASSIGTDIAGRVAMGASAGIMGVGAQAAPTKLSLSVPDPVIASTYRGVEGGVKGAVANIMATPAGEAAGKAIGTYATEKYMKPMVNQYAGIGLNEEQEAEALAAWNERYDYAPNAQQLYQFYTTQFVPNQQVDPGVIAGTPGYGSTPQISGLAIQPLPTALPAGSPPGGLPILAAGGGYINGIGGPKDDSNLARLSNGEFVMTERAVRGAGYGDRMDGAARMYDIMQGFERSAA